MTWKTNISCNQDLVNSSAQASVVQICYGIHTTAAQTLQTTPFKTQIRKHKTIFQLCYIHQHRKAEFSRNSKCRCASGAGAECRCTSHTRCTKWGETSHRCVDRKEMQRLVPCTVASLSILLFHHQPPIPQTFASFNPVCADDGDNAAINSVTSKKTWVDVRRTLVRGVCVSVGVVKSLPCEWRGQRLTYMLSWSSSMSERLQADMPCKPIFMTGCLSAASS